MLKHAFLCTAFATALAVPLAAEQTGTPPALQMPAQQLTETQIIDYSLIFPGGESAAPASALLTEISAWLAKNFDLPPFDQPPSVAFATPAWIAAFHYRSLLNGQQQLAAGNAPPTIGGGREIVAVYDTATQTIFLPHGWRGATPAEMSVLVHEMTHHLQARAQFKYECPQAREKLAYAAQNRWLDRFGLSLVSEFELDGLTLLVHTSCGL
jgi:Domain of unknown function (DUF6647)